MDKRIRVWESTFCFISTLGERVAASIGWIGSAYSVMILCAHSTSETKILGFPNFAP